MTTPAAAEPGRSVSRDAPHAKDTYVFDIAAGRRGAAINRLCASFKDERNRHDFLSDEEAYCSRFDLTDEQRRAILDRDWVGMLDLGASIFYLFKLAQVDSRSMQYLGGVFSGMTEEEFRSLMASGGRHFG
jgi:protocatechuate 4,5-dioxygenase alpha chain